MGHGAIVPVDMPNLPACSILFSRRTVRIGYSTLVAVLSAALLLFIGEVGVAREGTAFDLGFSLVWSATILVSYTPTPTI